VWLFSGLLLALLAVLVFRTLTAPASQLLRHWHRNAPVELTAAELSTMSWSAYRAHESALVAAVDAELADHIEARDAHLANRYAAVSPMHRSHLATDWNRSFELQPDGEPRGYVVLLHGLTDSPYSVRQLALFYRSQGFVALAPRLPGHGTVPAGLAAARWEQWLAAGHVALRDVQRRNHNALPVHLVGYSNGAALALMATLDLADGRALPAVDRLVLISPMIGVGKLGRFAGIFGWPSILPSFAGAAWIDVLPEYNPFKYNSFPVNGARQSSQLTRVLASRLASFDREQLPPILAFQSLADDTVSTQAVVDLFSTLGRKHELVLIDIDRSQLVDGLLSDSLPPAKRWIDSGDYVATVLSNGASGDGRLIEHRREAGRWVERATEWRYPFGVYSLSHIALPFPCDDPLYGLTPRSDEQVGIGLGALAVRGERGLLLVSQDDLTRMKCNPFFDDLLRRLQSRL
jgi:alpha-beta hydrolase superfamily lysophospholipase